MGVKYEYNDVYIEIPVDIMGASQIGISGVTIGTADDYDRIKGLLPTNCKINDAVSEECIVTSPSETAGGIVALGTYHSYTIKKKDDTLNCKVTEII